MLHSVGVHLDDGISMDIKTMVSDGTYLCITWNTLLQLLYYNVYTVYAACILRVCWTTTRSLSTTFLFFYFTRGLLLLYHFNYFFFKTVFRIRLGRYIPCVLSGSHSGLTFYKLRFVPHNRYLRNILYHNVWHCFSSLICAGKTRKHGRGVMTSTHPILAIIII